MRVIVCNDYKEVSRRSAQIVAGQIMIKPNCTLGLATGSTPLGTYENLIRMYEDGDLDFSSVVSFNLDEYYPLDAKNNQSYHYYMNENLFSKINIKPENTYILDGKAEDPNAECERFEKLIEANGGIDLQILGIGQNGHIGFNEPDYSLNSVTHLTDLTESTIKANSRFFEDMSLVPTQALTMGIGTILKAKKIILIANGAKKHRVVKSLLSGEINTSIPASMLKVHPDVTLICDREAYESSRIGVDVGGTDIKFGVIDDDHNVIERYSIPTPFEATADELCNVIGDKCIEIAKAYAINGIGMGVPGVIREGLVSSVNLKFDKYPLAKKLEKYTGLGVELTNDANCAALGEAFAGAGKDADNILLITLGTGIGGGIILGDRVYEGNGCAGEIGHMIIETNGRECPCGLKGCFEQYASTSALIKDATKAANENPDSLLAGLLKENGKLNGVLILGAVKDGCPVANKVFDQYTTWLANGIDGLINIFDPDMVVISGGISNAGEALTNPIQKKIHFSVPVKCSKLKNDAGIIGASIL